ncbi:unnamed protein product [Protopolystoma xenopodis]|uniref:PH domain-containing protein n=1 Tax=Protopolystoma xenopodis TaxID=117903 RepID=A0A448XHF5_9PLAT|nr:unnamed protein product [Protopolystoma xenopodis]
MFQREPPLDLFGAQASSAPDYTKRPAVFRVRLENGAELLFHSASEVVMRRWVTSINETATLLLSLAGLASPMQATGSGSSAQLSGPTRPHRSATLPIGSRPPGSLPGSSTGLLSSREGTPRKSRSFRKLFSRK